MEINPEATLFYKTLKPLMRHRPFTYPPPINDPSYGPLECYPEGSIRLLELYPGEEGTPIICELRVGSVKDEYTAVSYAWGSDTASHKITLKPWDFYVRQNLFECLSSLRDKHTTRILWIDAISVNQNDPSERGAQVRLMSQIFGNATNVVAWLGTTSEPAVAKLVHKPPPIQSVSSSPTQSLVDVTLVRDAVRGIRDICDRDYWRRMWIVQEILLASKLTIRCGSHTIPCESFRAWCTLIQAKTPLIPASFRDRDLIEAVESCRNAITDSRIFEVTSDREKRFRSLEPYPQLSALMSTYSDRLCTDPRDKMIALLSLAGDPPEGRRLDTEKMYKMTPRRLFGHVAKVYGFDKATKSRLIELIPL